MAGRPVVKAAKRGDASQKEKKKNAFFFRASPHPRPSSLSPTLSLQPPSPSAHYAFTADEWAAASVFILPCPLAPPTTPAGTGASAGAGGAAAAPPGMASPPPDHPARPAAAAPPDLCRPSLADSVTSVPE